MLAKILLSLAVILVANKMVKNLSLSIGIGAVSIALWSGQDLTAIINIGGERLLSRDNITLMILISLVISLSNQMNRSGLMRDLVSALGSRISKRGTLGALPAFIGLLPMPGGALFSAPLLDDCDDDAELSPMEKTRINYWFRHVWEFTWPLYPGVLLATDIAGIEVWQIFLIGLPLSLVSISAGYLFFLRPISSAPKKSSGTERKALLPVLAPIAIVIAVYIVVLLLLPDIAQWSNYLPMIIGLLAAIIFLQLRKPLARDQWKEIILNKRTATMILIVAVVRIYGAFIEAPLPSGVLLMEQLRLELAAFGVPMFLLIILIPFVSGVSTGVSVGFVGASFPIVFSLLGQDPGIGEKLAAMSLAYPFGFMGSMLSPVHVCLIVTNEHFNTELGSSLAQMIRPALCVMAGSLAVSSIISSVL